MSDVTMIEICYRMNGEPIRVPDRCVVELPAFAELVQLRNQHYTQAVEVSGRCIGWTVKTIEGRV